MATRKKGKVVAPATFSSHKLKQAKLHTGILRFSRLYARTSFAFKLALSFSLGLMMSVLTVIFAQSTGLYYGGTSAFFQGVARLVRVILTNNKVADGTVGLSYNILFWGLYTVFNICLLIFSYKKIGRQFTVLTLAYIITLQGAGFIWTQFVPQLGDVHVFGDTSTVNEALKAKNVNMLLFSSNAFPMVGADGVWNWDILRSTANSNLVNEVNCHNLTRTFVLFLYAVFYALSTSITCALLYITSSSSAGSDIISIYWSQEKNKSVSGQLMLMNSSGMFLGVLLGGYVSGILVDTSPEHYYAGWQYLISANLICSFVWVLLHSVLINFLFPWNKTTNVEIYTDKTETIRAKLREVGYIHPTTIIQATGGYSGVNKQILVTICTIVEIPNLIATIRTVDGTCLISTQYVVDLDGIMTMQKHAS